MNTNKTDGLRELQIAVCKALGWIELETIYGRLYGKHSNVLLCTITPEPSSGVKNKFLLPPLTLDLMHEAEKTMLFSQRQRFYAELQEVCSEGLESGLLVSIEHCIHATAEQRAIAFCKVKGIPYDTDKEATCKRCNGKRIIRVLGSGGDYEDWPCPDCENAPQPIADKEAMKSAEER